MKNNLTPLDSARTKWNMERVYTFDIESYNWVNPVALGMANNRNGEYQEFTGESCLPEFCNEIMRRKYRNCRFVAHNGGQYDFIPVIEHLVKHKEEYGLSIEILTKGSNDTPFLVRIEDANGKPRYLQDSMALLPRSLQSLTESFTPKEAKLDFDIERIDKWENMGVETRMEMLKYLKRDCVSLYSVLEEFTNVLLTLTDGKCPPQLTVGSTAMTAYRTSFMPEITIPNCYEPDKEQNPEDMFRNSYFGGRTEVYKMYGENLYHYDVNSLYPYAYTEKSIPIGNVSNTGTHFPLDNRDIGGVIKIKGTVPENCDIPVLPYRYSDEEITQERVIFPVGEIGGWYMAKEVRYARNVGALEDITIIDSYASEYGYPFKEYGKNLYELKSSIDKSKSPAKYKVVKFLLNSFYGKFGMDRDHKAVTVGPVTKEFQEGKEPINDDLTSMGIMLEESESEANYILPRIASSITAQGRIEMHKWFTKVRNRGGNVWYCDTDSVVTDIQLPEGEGLGEMDLEGTLKEGIFLAPKVYAERYEDGGELVKAKGMRSPDFTFDEFKEAYENNEPEIIGTNWCGPKGFKAGMKDGNDWFTVENYSRSLQQFDQKRCHHNNESKALKITE